MIFKERILLLLLIIFLCFISNVYSDCGCGQRCVKYSSDLQCTRCCTATVRRSVPVIPPDEVVDTPNAKVYDEELNRPVERPQYYIIPRSSRLISTSSSNSLPTHLRLQESKRSFFPNSEVLSQIIESLSQEAQMVRSLRRRRTLQKAKERLQFYERLKSERNSIQVTADEMELFDLLDSMLSRIRISKRNNYRI